MNTTLLRARDIEAYALSTLIIAPDASSRVPANDHAENPPAAIERATGSRRVLFGRAILGIAVAAIAFGFLNGRLFPSTAHSHQNPQVLAAVDQPRAVAAEPAMMKIVPIDDMVDPYPSLFIGSGDGSAGAGWTTRP
jgi:hypothetical protein